MNVAKVKSRREIPPTYIPPFGCPYNYYTNRNFWATGYYVSTVGLNTATIQKYIREQEKQDQIEDKLNTKEYEDPFKGSR